MTPSRLPSPSTTSIWEDASYGGSQGSECEGQACQAMLHWPAISPGLTSALAMAMRCVSHSDVPTPTLALKPTPPVPSLTPLQSSPSRRCWTAWSHRASWMPPSCSLSSSSPPTRPPPTASQATLSQCGTSTPHLLPRRRRHPPRWEQARDPQGARRHGCSPLCCNAHGQFSHTCRAPTFGRQGSPLP